MSRARTYVVIVSIAGAVALVAAAFTATAQTRSDPTPTTSTTEPPTTPTTGPQLLPGPSTTSTTTPAHKQPTTTTSTTDVPAGGVLGDEGAPPPGTPMVVPPDSWPLINSVKRSKPNNTAALLTALKPLLNVGLTQDQAVQIGFGRFPVGGQANFSDDWWTPRFTPVFHLHQGTDIFAAQGTPVRAPFDGVLRQSNEAVGGMSDYVTTPDGTFFYMAHLSAFVDGQKTGQRVKAGDVVGFVGATGDAAGGAPHCHFEIHPKGGAATDPKPYLDVWLNQDLANVPSLLAAYLGNRPAALLATALTRRSADGADSLFSAPLMPPQSQLLWASSASPGGALHLAEAAAVNAAGTVDWPVETERQAAIDQTEARSDLQARALLAPLTPAPLRSILGF